MNLIFSFAFGIVGLVLLIAGFKVASNSKRFLDVAKRVPGRVVSYVTKTETFSDGTTVNYIHPIVEFTDDKEIITRFTGSMGLDEKSNPPGSEVTVLYSPEHPDQTNVYYGIHSELQALVPW